MRDLIRRLEEAQGRGYGFGYAIDYDKEIAVNERQIAEYERLLAQGIYKPIAYAGEHMMLIDLLIVDPEARKRLGFTDDEVAAVAAYSDVTDLGRYGLPDPGERFGAQARAVEKRMDAIYTDPLHTKAELEKLLAGEKRRLSQHKRNKQKHGR